MVGNKTPKQEFNQSMMRDYFKQFRLPNQIRKQLLGVYFYAYLLHRFWDASDLNLEGFRVHVWFIVGLFFVHFLGHAAKLQKRNT